jgi:hypothetical protein
MATDSAYALDYPERQSLLARRYVEDDCRFHLQDIYAYLTSGLRNDIQGVCDSMSFVQRDSCYRAWKSGFWNEGNQILGNRIDIYLNDSTIEKAHVRDYALAIQDRQVTASITDQRERPESLLY